MFDFDDQELTQRHTAGNASGGCDGAQFVDEAITSRRSVRGFTDQSVPRALIEHLLLVAARAPSGTNMQPWRSYVLTGAAKQRLTARILENRPETETRTWKYYPDEFPPLYKARRRKIGLDLYGLAGVEKGDAEGAQRQRDRNYEFFGAPVGIIFTISNELEVGSWIDYGCFIQNIMTAARAYGLHSCPQAIFSDVPTAVRSVVPMSDDEIVVCGLSVGYIDDSVDVNALETERAPLEEWVDFIDA